MSGGAQRYVPPRDRSPRERAPSFANSSTPRDPPSRDSRMPNDAPRPPYAGSSYAPRGGRGGFSSRSDYRSEYRDREPLRDRRDTSPYSTLDRDRSWRDRDSDRGRSPRSPPPPRPRERDFRDFRDVSRGRPRRPSFDSDFSGPTYTRGRGSFGLSPPARAGSFRGRGRGDWESRGGRGRGYPPDERGDLFRPRSRSPRRWADDDRSLGRRDDYRPAIRDERPRDDRHRDASPARGPPLARRPSLPSINTVSSTTSPAPAGQPQSARPYDVRDNRDGSRRMSAINSAEPRELIRESPRSTDPPPARLHAQTTLPPPARVNSPPKPTEIPAFGSVPVRPTQAEGWNVWKAPAEPKHASKPAPEALKSQEPIAKPDVPLQPPTAPRALIHQESRSFASPTSTSAPSPTPRIVAQPTPHPPSGPAADRDVASSSSGTTTTMAKSPPTGPRFGHAPSGPRAGVRADAPPPLVRSPTMPATIPTGPRGSVTSLGSSSGIPTGPRADRAAPSNRLPPTGPAAMPSWQRPRGPPGSATQSTSPLIPAKRDNAGEVKERRSVSPPRGAPRALSPRRSLDALNHEKPISGDRDVVSEASLKRMSTQRALEEEEEDDEDPMDLFDEQDSERAEAIFLRNKTALEAKKTDLDTPHFRADDILERLALLNALSIRDLAPLVSKKGEEIAGADATAKGDNSEGARAPEDMLTPKTEDKERTDTPADVEMADVPAPESPEFREESIAPSTPPRVPSPEINNLPFLNREPITPISELDMYQETQAKQEAIKDALHAKLLEQTKLMFDRHEDMCSLYAQTYRAWRLEVREIEREHADNDREETIEEPAAAEVIPDLTTPNSAPTTAEGRRSRYTSEYSLEQALKKSQETAKAEQAQREREAAQAKRDPDKEADIPEMLAHDKVYAAAFKDTAHRRDPSDAVEFWRLQPHEDDFTPEEHSTMLDNYRQFPKKWGKIAQALAGRTYKDCINHYYATKWDKEFKPKVKTKSRKTGKTGKVPGGAKSLRANHLLNDVGVDVYGADDAAAPLVSRTTGGRPKRAAAPTSFNDTDPTSGAGKRSGGRPAATGEPSAEKAPRKPKGAARASTTQRKSGRQAAAARQRSPSPLSKAEAGVEPRAPDSGPVPLYAPPKDPNPAGGLAPMANTPQHHNLMLRGNAELRYGQVQDLIGPSQGIAGPGDGGGRPPTAAQQRGTPSSYWSVQETNKFPDYLDAFGTDWQAIATHMGSKSATMVGAPTFAPHATDSLANQAATQVKNHFQRLITSGRNDIAEIAGRRDEQRKAMDKTIPPPPPPPPQAVAATSPIKQRPDHTPLGTPTSRMLARKPEIIDIDDDSPGVKGPSADYAARFGPYTAPGAPPSLVPTQPVSGAPDALRPGSVGKPREPIDWSQGVPRSRYEPDYPSPFAEGRYPDKYNERPESVDYYRGRPERAPLRVEEEPLDFRRSTHAATAAISSRQKVYEQDRPSPFGQPPPQAAGPPRPPSSSERMWSSSVSRPEVLQPSPADRLADRIGPTHSSISSHYGRPSSPPPQVRMPAFSPTHTPSYTPARPVDISGRDAGRPGDKMHPHSSVFAQDTRRPHSGPSTPFYENTGRPAYPPLDDRRAVPAPIPGTVPPPRTQTPVAQPPKPKKSTLSAILNPEPEDPKPARSLPTPSAPPSRTRSPPPQMYGSHGPPSRPASQMERPGDAHYADPRGMPSAYQPGSLGHLSHASPPMPSHEPVRPHSSLHDRPPATMQPSSQPPPQHPFARMDTPSLLSRPAPGLSNMRSPAHNASPPPPPQSYGGYAPPPALHASRGLHSREPSYSRAPPSAYSDRRETYGERPYGGGPPAHTTTSMTPQPVGYGSPFAAPPPLGPGRYAPLGGNQDAHSHNTGLVSGYGPRDPSGGRSYGGDPYERELRERREREQQQQQHHHHHHQLEGERSRQYAPPGGGGSGSSSGGAPGGGPHSGYAYIPGRDR